MSGEQESPTVLLRHHSMRLFALFLALTLSACHTVTKHGDARLVDPGRIQLFPSMSALRFPKISIGRRAHYHFEVRNLPRPIYPEGVRIKIPVRELNLTRSQQPWLATVLSVRLTTPEGVSFLQQTLDFNTARGRTRFKLRSDKERWNLFKGPSYLNYDVDVKVVSPSKRSTDEVEIEAWTF